MNQTMTQRLAGWDIGGAHVKLALLDASGQVLDVAQRACPLWKGIQYLRATLTDLARDYDLRQCRHVVTMTGELADCFASREQGVLAIVQVVSEHFGSERVSVFAGQQGFLPVARIKASDCMAIASANWLASVMLVANRVPNALFVDIGSTTTDILLIQNHQLAAEGFTDYQRLVSGELVYTGIIRTSVMAIAQDIEFNGTHMGLMAEHFATMADVYRLTGDLNEAHDQSETADGTEKTLSASARRLSRLTGYEFDASDGSLWLEFAERLKAKQIDKIASACLKQIQRVDQRSAIQLVGAGVGRFLAKQIAGELGIQYLDFVDLVPVANDNLAIDAGDCAPAAAVAYLQR